VKSGVENLLYQNDSTGQMNVPLRRPWFAGLPCRLYRSNLSTYGYIYLMKHKSKTFEKFKEF
jgi:hypothetical protein